jgi:hypothetical protein
MPSSTPRAPSYLQYRAVQYSAPQGSTVQYSIRAEQYSVHREQYSTVNWTQCSTDAAHQAERHKYVPSNQTCSEIHNGNTDNPCNLHPWSHSLAAVHDCVIV